MTLPFHPLADLFPLIEGKEFDDLVASIKENGQREPIVTYEDSILDGRNRYRACEAGGVVPIIIPFTGSDPIRFVMDVNIHRRHLNESQRAMIAAKLANLKDGQRADLAQGVQMCTPSETPSDTVTRAPAMSAEQAADLLNVGRHSVFAAKKVLKEGTAEEVKAVERGEAAVNTIAKEIRKNKPPEQRKKNRENGLSQAGKNPARIERQRINAQVWGQLRDALVNLTSLPLPVDVVGIARTLDRTDLVNNRLLQALAWLEGFSDAWTRNSDQAEAENENRDDHSDAGNGNGATGAQQPQPPAE